MTVNKYVGFALTLLTASLFYTGASFYAVTRQFSVPVAIAVSSCFAVVEYMFKIPAFKIGTEFLSVTKLQLIWVVATFLTTLAYQGWILKKPVKRKTVAIVVIIIGLMGYSYYDDLSGTQLRQS